jgi:hypothetical protein
MRSGEVSVKASACLYRVRPALACIELPPSVLTMPTHHSVRPGTHVLSFRCSDFIDPAKRIICTLLLDGCQRLIHLCSDRPYLAACKCMLRACTPQRTC